MDTDTAPIDPIDLLSRLTAAEIQRRLDELDAEARSLRVLLRSARARERTRHRLNGEEAVR